MGNEKNSPNSRKAFIHAASVSGPGHHGLRHGTLRAMDNAKKSSPTFKKPDLAAIRRAVASSTAIETGQSIHVLEQKLKEPSKRRFTDVKLAD